MTWFYNLKLTKKLSITFAVGLLFNLLTGIFAITRIGDLGHAAESRGMIIGLMAAYVVIGGWLNYFIVFRVIYRSLWYAIRSLETVAEGDLSQNIRVKSTEEIGQIFAAIKMMIEKMREVSNHINELTHALNDSSQELLGTTEAMNSNAHEQTGQTEQAASAVMQMSQTFGDVASNADQASQASQNTSEAAKTGFSTVAELMEEMQRIVSSVEESSVTIGKLGQSSRQIGEIVATIEEVADMTNLLALNAAIEAARAGEYGRGFAVVADEVRSLAERTGKATHEITAMIKTIQADTAQAVTSMMNSKRQAGEGLVKAEEARGALGHIVEVSDKSMDMINTIAAATEEQSSVSEQVSSYVEQIACGTRSTESAAVQIQGKAQHLAQLSAELEETARWFRVA
jgi:methyl-accepting chemotaxis protein